MRYFIVATACIIMTLSGLCSAMGVFAMEQHLANEQGNRHAMHGLTQTSEEHESASIQSSMPFMACCEAPSDHGEEGVMSGSSAPTDHPYATLKTPRSACEIVSAHSDIPEADAHSPNNFERRSLAKRE